MKTHCSGNPVSAVAATTLISFFLVGCATGPKLGGSAVAVAKMEPAALELLQSVSAKLGSARTIQVVADHKLDPKLGLGIHADRGPIQLTVERPNKFLAIQPAGNETREIAFDGSTLCIMYPEAKHYALEPLAANSVEQFAQLVDERFGFRPPMSELLANDMAAELLIDVTSARMLGTERVGGTRCGHLRLDQEGMTTDLWVGVEDQLPRRLLTTVTDMPGHPTWDIRFSKWKLNAPIDASLFSKRPSPGSQKVQMIKNQ